MAQHVHNCRSFVSGERIGLLTADAEIGSNYRQHHVTLYTLMTVRFPDSLSTK